MASIYQLITELNFEGITAALQNEVRPDLTGTYLLAADLSLIDICDQLYQHRNATLNIFETERRGRCALHLCAGMHDFPIILSHYADVEVPPVDSQNNTVLHCAAMQTHADNCKLILKRWPRLLNARDKRGQNALKLVTLYPKPARVIDVLISHGAELTTEDTQSILSNLFHLGMVYDTKHGLQYYNIICSILRYTWSTFVRNAPPLIWVDVYTFWENIFDHIDATKDTLFSILASTLICRRGVDRQINAAWFAITTIDEQRHIPWDITRMVINYVVGHNPHSLVTILNTPYIGPKYDEIA